MVERSVSVEEVPAEVGRFHEALEHARIELRGVRQELAATRGHEHLYIIDAHLMILDDSMLVRETTCFIEKT